VGRDAVFALVSACRLLIKLLAAIMTKMERGSVSHCTVIERPCARSPIGRRGGAPSPTCVAGGYAPLRSTRAGDCRRVFYAGRNFSAIRFSRIVGGIAAVRSRSNRDDLFVVFAVHSRRAPRRRRRGWNCSP